MNRQNIKQKYKQCKKFIKAKEEKINKGIEVVSYIYIYYTLIVLINNALFMFLKNVITLNVLFYSLIYLLIFISTIKISKNKPYKLLGIILILQIFN